MAKRALSSHLTRAATRLSLEQLDPASRLELNRIQVDSLLAHTSTASAISTLAALILSMYLAPAVGVEATQAWFVLKVASALPRFVLAQAYQRGFWRPNVGTASRVVVTSLAIDGAIWGLAGIWCAGRQSETMAGLLLGCLSSVAMLATFGLQVQLRATAAFVLPIMAPMAAALALRGDALGITGAGGALLVLVQTLVTGYASERRVTREYVAHERLERALEERSHALNMASESSRGLEQALVEVKRQSAVKALFLGTMSHELRTPLHGILGLTDLLRRRSTDPRATHQLSLIEASGTHLLELIGALLDVSRIDAGRLELHPAAFDLALEVRNMADLYELRSETKGISFHSNLEIGKTCWVIADAARIRQVLHNLLGNAVKFTKRGSVRFSVTRSHGSFQFDIIDTGPGIASDELPHVFEAFRQAGESVARPADGTGLGLTIARELAVAMGGDIVASSQLGFGSHFAFAAPLEQLPHAEVPQQTYRAGNAIPCLRTSCRVLLVEDNDVNALIAHAHLDSFGALTMRAHDGQEGMEAATKSDRADIVLMDCRMPVMDGLAATRAIRAWERKTGSPRIPIIALTATPSAEDRADCLAAGMDAFLTKPFTDAQLLDAIQKYIEADTTAETDAMHEFVASLDDSEDFIPLGTLH